jgi:hypothetical protein
MQRTEQHPARGAVVAALSALLLVLTGGAYGATAAPAQHSGHRLSAVRVASPDNAPEAVPHSHRAQHLQRLDGSGPALLPDRAGSPRPSYTAARTRPTRELPVVHSHGTADGRAPPA